MPLPPSCESYERFFRDVQRCISSLQYSIVQLKLKLTPSNEKEAVEAAPLPGLVKLDISSEAYRSYQWTDKGVKHGCTIHLPQFVWFRPGGSTHRVVKRNGVVHCIPAPGHMGCVLTWESLEGKSSVVA